MLGEMFTLLHIKEHLSHYREPVEICSHHQQSSELTESKEILSELYVIHWQTGVSGYLQPTIR
jgi:hypothetical protein